MKILFVCLGNICRSPMAEGIMKQKIQQEGLSGWLVDSAGTASYHLGKQPDERTLGVCQKNGIQLNHKARAVLQSDFETFDYLIAMDKSNYQYLLNRAPKHIQQKVWLMRNVDTEQTGADVPDPYYGDERDFEDVFQILNRCCTLLLKKLQSVA